LNFVIIPYFFHFVLAPEASGPGVGKLNAGIKFVNLIGGAMVTTEIALSADRAEDFNELEGLLQHLDNARLICRREEPIDLMLRERISWFNQRHAPDMIVASYRRPFADLKVIADLKKLPAFQWVPVIVIVDEEIKNTRTKFLEFGVTEVLTWKSGEHMVLESLTHTLHELAVPVLVR
jgi:hypothetical protein